MWTNQDQDQTLTGPARRRGILASMLEDSAPVAVSEGMKPDSGSNTKSGGSSNYPTYVSSAFDSYPY